MPRPLVLAASGAVAVQCAPASAALLPQAARMLGIPARLPSKDAVLLTFDDGPHPSGTPAVLGQLDRAGWPAVFFLSGEQVARHPDLAREIAAAGHELALHGYRHQTRRQWTTRSLADDTRRALDVVSDISGAAPRLYRPPHGVFTMTGLSLIRRLGLEPLLWSRWGRDWDRRASAASITQRVTAGLRTGDVILLHDADHYAAPGSWRATAAALPAIVERIASAGLRAGRVHVGQRGDGLTLLPQPGCAASCSSLDGSGA